MYVFTSQHVPTQVSVNGPDATISATGGGSSRDVYMNSVSAVQFDHMGSRSHNDPSSLEPELVYPSQNNFSQASAGGHASQTSQVCRIHFRIIGIGTVRGLRFPCDSKFSSRANESAWWDLMIFVPFSVLVCFLPCRLVPERD